MLLPPFTVARNVSTLKGCFTTRHPVPVVDSSFYSEQSVRKTRIISLSDRQRPGALFSCSEIRGLGDLGRSLEAAKGRLITVNVRCAPKATADAHGSDL